MATLWRDGGGRRPRRLGGRGRSGVPRLFLLCRASVILHHQPRSIISGSGFWAGARAHDGGCVLALGPALVPRKVGRVLHTLGAHACLFISLYLLFASVGRALKRIIASLTWTLFTSLLTHRLVLLCVDAGCFIFWDVPGDVLAAPESALCGWIGVILLSLSLSCKAHGHHTCICQQVSSSIAVSRLAVRA